jgi:hypothetical protein
MIDTAIDNPKAAATNKQASKQREQQQQNVTVDDIVQLILNLQH